MFTFFTYISSYFPPYENGSTMLVTKLCVWADVARTLYTMDVKYWQIRGPWTFLNYV